MDARPISDTLAVSPQLQPDDIPAAKAAGYRAIICNRPDGEGADQPGQAAMAEAARAAGLAFRYLPVTPGAAAGDTVEAFGRALAELPGPVLAYCRTGTRSATLWALAEAGRRPARDILSAAQAAGYDLGGLAARITASGPRAEHLQPAQ